MPPQSGLLFLLAAALGLAFVLGLLAVRLRLPPLVGYLLAGVAVGPQSPGFVADVDLARQLAEIGVILLMFGVGIRFSMDDLLSQRRVALPGAAVQIAAGTLLGATLARLWGWSWESGLVFGVCLSVASTVVVLRSLEDRGLLDSVDGRLAVGWLVVQDLAMVLVLVLLPVLAAPLGALPGAAAAGDKTPAETIGLTLGKVGAFVLLMVVVGRRAVPWLLERVARVGSRELFTLSVLVVALGIAVGASALFGVSFALGAFFAGVVVNGSDLSHEAAADALPMRDAFSVLFFVAVGMLFDPGILVRQPLQTLAVLLIVMVGTPIGAAAIVLLFGHPLQRALVIAASLAQIGEFSFILAALGVSLGLLTAEAQSLIVAGALLTISLNPLAFEVASRFGRWAMHRPRLLSALERGTPQHATAHGDGGLREHAILVGYGRVGGTIGEGLAGARVPYVVIEQSRELFESLRDRGVPAVYGNAARPTVLALAHPDRARLIIVTAPDPFQARAVVEQARRMNPGIVSVVRTHSEVERAYLERAGVGLAVMGERELARTMARYALEAAGAERASSRLEEPSAGQARQAF